MADSGYGSHRNVLTFLVSSFSSVADTAETSHFDLPIHGGFQAVLFSITLFSIKAISL